MKESVGVSEQEQGSTRVLRVSENKRGTRVHRLVENVELEEAREDTSLHDDVTTGQRQEN